MKVTWRGHAFFEIECGNGAKVLVDPFVSNGKTTKDVAYFRRWKPDVVLVTHGHFDHLGQAKDIGAPVVSIYEIAEALGREGVAAEGMNIGGTLAKKGVRFTMTFAAHSSGLPSDGAALAMGGASTGFVIDDGETRLYHSGDTGLFGDMKTVIAEHLKPDAALLPIGGLYTMDPHMAGVATRWLGVKHVVPMHYNTFPAIEQDANEFVKAVGKAAEVHVLDVDASARF